MGFRPLNIFQDTAFSGPNIYWMRIQWCSYTAHWELKPCWATTVHGMSGSCQSSGASPSKIWLLRFIPSILPLLEWSLNLHPPFQDVDEDMEPYYLGIIELCEVTDEPRVVISGRVFSSCYPSRDIWPCGSLYSYFSRSLWILIRCGLPYLPMPSGMRYLHLQV